MNNVLQHCATVFRYSSLNSVVVDPSIVQGSQLRGAQTFIGSARFLQPSFGTTPNASPFYVLSDLGPLSYLFLSSFFYHSASSHHSSLSSVTHIDAQKSHNHEFSVHYF